MLLAIAITAQLISQWRPIFMKTHMISTTFQVSILIKKYCTITFRGALQHFWDRARKCCQSITEAPRERVSQIFQYTRSREFANLLLKYI